MFCVERRANTNPGRVADCRRRSGATVKIWIKSAFALTAFAVLALPSGQWGAMAQTAGEQPSLQAPVAGAQPQELPPLANQPAAQRLEPVLVVLGDSLGAGYNLPGDKAFPAVLEAALQRQGYKVKVLNAAVSGDTTTGGLERLDWSVPDNASGVILELGANDMLRGLDTAIPRDALNRIITRLKERNIPVMLAGMQAAPNLGGRYADEFGRIYQDLSARYNLVLYPFFLEGVAGKRDLLLPDGMHPNPEGVEVMVRNILPTVERFLGTLQPAHGASSQN